MDSTTRTGWTVLAVAVLLYVPTRFWIRVQANEADNATSRPAKPSNTHRRTAEAPITIPGKDPRQGSGQVKWFSAEKGYGLITDSSNTDFYFNVKSINGAALPETGDRVFFEPHQGSKKGPRAANVTISKQLPPPRPRKTDDRVVCPGCSRRIVPRLIVYRGDPQRSVCPYCAATVSSFEGCFIATAVYGGSECQEVKRLRAFRDQHLATHGPGQLFIHLYYRISPPIADWLVARPRYAAIVRRQLDRLLHRLPQQPVCAAVTQIASASPPDNPLLHQKGK